MRRRNIARDQHRSGNACRSLQHSRGGFFGIARTQRRVGSHRKVNFRLLLQALRISYGVRSEVLKDYSFTSQRLSCDLRLWPIASLDGKAPKRPCANVLRTVGNLRRRTFSNLAPHTTTRPDLPFANTGCDQARFETELSAKTGELQSSVSDPPIQLLRLDRACPGS